jgi:hypothetical protein
MEAFWTITTICEHLLPEYYTPSMVGIEVDLQIFEKLLSTKIPDVHHHLVTLSVPVSAIVWSWFMSLYTSGFPSSVRIDVLNVNFISLR